MEPLISCICVTNSRQELLDKAVQAFKNQTYSNKELIVVFEDMPFIKETSQIKCMKISKEPKLNLGMLRNLGITYSQGDYFMQWDDDDWYGDTRIEDQYNYLKDKNGDMCTLSQILIYNYVDKEAYLSHKRVWECSLLCDKRLFDVVKYQNVAKGEDSYFLNALNDYNMVQMDKPELYVRTYHGNNTWDRNHFDRMFNVSVKLNEEKTKEIERALNYECNSISRVASV